MKTISDRLAEFTKYHIQGDGECNNVVLKAWAENNKLTLQDKYVLAFLFSVTYCVGSSIVLFREYKKRDGLRPEILAELKPTIIFQSDRKYMRMKDNFEKCVLDHENNHKSVSAFLHGIIINGIINMEMAIKSVQKWVMYGRFASYLFLETFVELTGIPTDNTTIDWKHGDTATSGLLNVFGFDEAADAFDKTGKLGAGYDAMNKMLAEVNRSIEAAGGVTNVTEVETSLCAYRKFYKGSRYNGYYLDRMLEEIYAMKDSHPDVAEEILRIRAGHFDKKYLGEYGGWTGIRKELKTLYRETGIVS